MKLKFSENLRYALSSRQLSQQDLAEHLGVTQATVSRWVKGVNEPSLALLLEICVFLDETPNSMLGYED